MAHKHPTVFEQTRPPELFLTDDEKNDDWTFSINVQYHHAYPEIKGYRRTSNGVTIGDREPWRLQVRVGQFGYARLHIDFPDLVSRWTGEKDGIWACPNHRVSGFQVFAFLLDKSSKFTHMTGMGRSITFNMPCSAPGAFLDLEFTAPDHQEGDYVDVIFQRFVLWDSPPIQLNAAAPMPYTVKKQGKDGDGIQRYHHVGWFFCESVNVDGVEMFKLSDTKSSLASE